MKELGFYLDKENLRYCQRWAGGSLWDILVGQYTRIEVGKGTPDRGKIVGCVIQLQLKHAMVTLNNI